MLILPSQKCTGFLPAFFVAMYRKYAIANVPQWDLCS